MEKSAGFHVRRSAEASGEAPEVPASCRMEKSAGFNVRQSAEASGETPEVPARHWKLPAGGWS
jgi:hypothetical protein